jgi:small Trp-rich protein
MAFVILGVVLILMNLAGVGWPGQWTWNLTGDLWKFGVPFGCALVWWAFSDSMGYTQRRESDKIDAKREERRQRNMEALGLQKPKRGSKSR